jgi:hypothetical protein
MDRELVRTLSLGNLKAEIYSLNMPGEFCVVYSGADGKTLEEAPLTGISTYHQREPEIKERLAQLAAGAEPNRTPYRGDPGEY